MSASIEVDKFIKKHRYELGSVMSFAKFVESCRYKFANYNRASFKAGSGDIVVDLICGESDDIVEFSVSKMDIYSSPPIKTLDKKIYAIQDMGVCLWKAYIELLNYWKL